MAGAGGGLPPSLSCCLCSTEHSVSVHITGAQEVGTSGEGQVVCGAQATVELHFKSP